jgi:carboxyl-terminal processing protease
MTNIYDPHTDYFNPKEKEDFNINMSGRLEGIGARLQTDGDYTRVVSIVPGGPAWKQKELQVDDLIIKVKQEDEEEPVNVTGMHIDDVVSLIRGKKGTVVTLTVKKVDGSITQISIERDEVILDEGFVRSLIVEDEGTDQKIGYIQLPRFYADFENPKGRSCAEDVKKELEKLKKHKVDGIIFDLRNNSGGSLNDVVEMSGLFIETGPIVQVKSRSSEPQVLEDKDASVVWDGPLLVMVNAYSASASEILAAALQDYERAIIVGGTSTFGKGTVQRFFDLDRVIRDNTEAKPLGELKFTIQKFYRINGGSTQLRGVYPDITLPDNFSLIETGEKQMEHPLQWTEIDALDYTQDITNLPDIELLRRESEKRIQSDSIFAKVEAYAVRMKELRDDSTYPLQIEQYRAEIEARDAESESYKSLFNKIEDMSITNLPEDLDYIQSDSSRIARNDAWVASVHKDIYIDESMEILYDMSHPRKLTQNSMDK